MAGSRWQGRKILSSPLPTDTLSLQLNMDQFPLEKKKHRKTLKLGEQHIGKKIKKTTKWVEEAETQTHPKPHPQCDNLQSEFKTWTFSLRRKGFESHIRHHNF